jgi:hypothetical protein
MRAEIRQKFVMLITTDAKRFIPLPTAVAEEVNFDAESTATWLASFAGAGETTIQGLAEGGQPGKLRSNNPLRLSNKPSLSPI